MSSISILLWYSLMYLSKLTDYILHLQQVIFVIELVSFEKFRETWDMWLVLKGEGTRSLKDPKDFHLFSSSTQIYLRHPSPRSEEEKIDFATARKEVGTRLFKEGRYPLAMERYKKIVDLFSYIESFKVRQMNLFFSCMEEAHIFHQFFLWADSWHSLQSKFVVEEFYLHLGSRCTHLTGRWE